MTHYLPETYRFRRLAKPWDAIFAQQWFDVEKQLQNRLEELHGELQGIKYVDEGEQRLLQELMSDIQKLIRSGESNAPDQLGDRLKEGIELFEASHPRATMLMGQVIDALAKMGI